ncbi:L-rhamnose mutarotase [Cyclobacterium marinum]|uniref:L-rhamnose mutarotase n=2 Tax=Cyclobacterium marinum TaxID=104 RepID=G0J5Y4_CYCMS|nr:L-rhamnose mutarotase [Cyclobacterium marinum]AEL26047.1 L-rhamnose 1-epimerase [Cyclobacterium marinum DSM 745]
MRAININGIMGLTPRSRKKIDKTIMISVAFTMKLLPGNEEEYEKRHNEIWPELAELLREAGIREYHIFLDKATGTLFAFQNLEEENQTNHLAKETIMKKWWAFMGDIMETNPDQSPKVNRLEKVFSL